MIGATRRWFQRNRKGLAIGAGVLGAGYLAGQYLLTKISEARERMSSDRIAKEKQVVPILQSLHLPQDAPITWLACPPARDGRNPSPATPS